MSDETVDQSLGKIARLMQGKARTPSQGAADLASEWLRTSYDHAAKLGGWRSPHISSTEAGEVVFEWWQEPRKLTLYFADSGAEYLQVWGSDIENEMISGHLTDQSFSNAWLWLHDWRAPYEYE